MSDGVVLVPWVVAPALAALTVGYWIVLRRPLGVSGVLARFSRIGEEAEFDRGAAVLQAEQAALEAAMAEMTAEAFGPALAATGTDGPVAVAARAPAAATEWPAPEPAAPPTPQGRVCAPTPRLGVHAIFLVALAAGGLLAALARGTFGAGMGGSFAAHLGTGPGALGAALVQLGEGKVAAVVSVAGMLAGCRLHDALRKRLGWARHSCID